MFKVNHNIMELYLKLLPVQIFLVLASSLSYFVNGIITGNLLNAVAMVALGLATPFCAILSSIATIFSGGSGILCGNYMGRGETEKVNEVYSVSIIMALVTGLALTLIVPVFASQFAVLLGADAETLPDTMAYIRGMALGLIPTMIMPVQMTFLQMCNKSGVSLLATILLAIFNSLFSLVAVNVFNTGIFGIGAATSLARWVTALLMGIYLLVNKDLVTFRPKAFNLGMAGQILKLGSPATLANFLYPVRNVFINKYAFTVGGIDAVNALAILGSFGGFLDMVNIGVGAALTMLASVFVGERDTRSLKELMKVELICGMSLCAVKLFVVYVFGDDIAVLCGAEGNVVPLAHSLFIWYGWSAPLNMVTLLFMGIYQSLGRVTYCNSLYPLNCIIVPFICCAFISKFTGITAIWSCYAWAEVATLIAMYLYASFRKKAPATSVDDMLFLDKNFDTANKISLTVRDLDEIVKVSESIQNFCAEQGIDNKRAMLSGVCMEEMAANVVKHGFNKDKKKDHSIDVFACVENDEVLLRMRDDCQPFDPKSKLEMYDDEDPMKNFGIKMVSKIAKEMNYQTTFGMNVLTIKL